VANDDVKRVPFSRLKEAFKTINHEVRGTDEEYAGTILKEYPLKGCFYFGPVVEDFYNAVENERRRQDEKWSIAD